MFLRYGSGFEELVDEKLTVAQELTCFLQLRPPDRVTALHKRVNAQLCGVSWTMYERRHYNGGYRSPGWVGSTPEIDVFTAASTPPAAEVATCGVLRSRQPEGSTSWFPAHIRPVTGTIEHINEISLTIAGGQVTGVDTWLLESAVVHSVDSSSPRGVLGKARCDEGRSLVVISALLSNVHWRLS